MVLAIALIGMVAVIGSIGFISDFTGENDVEDFSLQEVNKVCVINDAGFDLHWHLRDMENDGVSAESPTYPID